MHEAFADMYGAIRLMKKSGWWENMKFSLILSSSLLFSGMKHHSARVFLHNLNSKRVDVNIFERALFNSIPNIKDKMSSDAFIDLLKSEESSLVKTGLFGKGSSAMTAAAKVWIFSFLGLLTLSERVQAFERYVNQKPASGIVAYNKEDFVKFSDDEILRVGKEYYMEKPNDPLNEVEGNMGSHVTKVRLLSIEKKGILARMVFVDTSKNYKGAEYVVSADLISARPGSIVDINGQDKARASNYGGIDLNSANLHLQIKRDGRGVPLPLLQQDWAQLSQIQGFIPTIIEIKPVTMLPILSELQQKLRELATSQI
jgi:hypothetical protein